MARRVAAADREAEDRVPGEGNQGRLRAGPHPPRSGAGLDDGRRLFARAGWRRAVPGGGGGLLRRQDRRRLGKEKRDFARQLAKRGFVALSLGSDPNSYFPDKKKAQLQPLSFHAYMAANCYNALANLPQVDPKRIGIVGHSYGGKSAMFASCLYDKFACAAGRTPASSSTRSAQCQLLGAVVSRLRTGSGAEAWHPRRQGPAHGTVPEADRGGPRPDRAARPDGAAAVPGVGRHGRHAGTLEGARPRRRGEQIPRLRGPCRHDQPRGARADRRIE